MRLLNKKLKSIMEVVSPEKQADLGILCKKSAETLSRTSAILLEAGEAFHASDFSKGCSLLQKAEDALTKT